MAKTDLIPRDLGHEFNSTDAEDLTLFRQHGCIVPSCTQIANRLGVAIEEDMPELLGGESVDRIFNMIVPEIAGPNSVQIPDPLNPLVTIPRLSTPDVTVPDTFFFRQMAHGIQIPTPGNVNPHTGVESVEVWSFDDSGAGGQTRVWPAPTIRAREGDLCHTFLTTRRGTHTIHQHAIEPTTMNDGVGHISFEVDGEGYRYQWLASEAGTYFYHCHKNTVLHFEMGMYGYLIVDPDVTGAPFIDGQPGVIRRGNELISYDAEALWAPDEIDRRWHSVVSDNVDAGVECDFFHATIDGTPIPNTLNNPVPNGPDPLLHRFEPDVFVISGITGLPQLGTAGTSFGLHGLFVIDENLDPAFVVRKQIARGDKLIVRLLCAGYNTQILSFPFDVELIEVDARFLGFGDRQQYSSPRIIPANTRFDLTTARRNTVLIDTANIPPGIYEIDVEYWDWIAHKQLKNATMRTTIEII